MKKPRIFLSHSKKDLDFIEKVCHYLKEAQIDVWFDSNMLRHGKPWMDGIFQKGIQSCDSALIYLTKNSLSSEMVQREIDAVILHQLENPDFTIFPYVKNKNLIKDIRKDIQRLQTPIWNEDTFFDLLPRVVSEIWSSYKEKIVNDLKDKELKKRKVLERKLKKINTSIKNSPEFLSVKAFMKKEAELSKGDFVLVFTPTLRYDRTSMLSTIITNLNKGVEYQYILYGKPSITVEWKLFLDDITKQKCNCIPLMHYVNSDIAPMIPATVAIHERTSNPMMPQAYSMVMNEIESEICVTMSLELARQCRDVFRDTWISLKNA